MAGMAIAMPRHLAVPTAIACGCDVFLFCRNAEEDLAYMKKGVEDGIITQERLRDAVCKVLALKASLRLHEKKADGTLIPDIEKAKAALAPEKHKLWAAECADRAVTLVKEEKGVLPLSPQKTKRMLFYPIQSDAGVMYSVDTSVAGQFEKLLRGEGFDVTVYKPSPGLEGMMSAQSEILDNFDVIVYLANMATKSNQTIVRIEWAQPMGANVPVYMSQVPTLFISVENPYHLIDVPRVRTFINAYHSTPVVLNAIVDKLMGRSEFKGKSPVDAFCGKWDTRLG
jgi:beta-N-acetylhexosaminidase